MSARPDTVQEGAIGSAAIEWQSEMTLLTNRFFLGDCVKWTLLSTLLCAAVFMPVIGIAAGRSGLVAAVLFPLIVPVLIVFGVLVFVVIMGNRVPMAFSLNDAGITFKTTSERIKTINNLAFIIGLLAGKPGAMGAGIGAKSQERCHIPWPSVSKVHFFPNQKVIFVRGNILSRLRLYCTPANYEAVEKMMLTRTPAGAKVIR